jgi:hypothetical protein
VRAGLPDVLFSNQKYPFGKSWMALELIIVLYFMTIWNILLPFDVVCCPLVYISRFGIFGPKKIWQPWCGELLV